MRHEKAIGRQRQRRAFRVTNRIKRDSTRPRLSVFRSVKHIYAQIIDDKAGRTLVMASTVDKGFDENIKTGNKTAAEAVGKALAERALQAGIKQVAFDRRSYMYHGRIAALADAARKAGLEFLNDMSTETSTRGELIEKVIKIRRCAAVVKGGRRFSFTALVVVGDGRGKVGWGYGKANEVPPAVEKAVKDGSRNMMEVSRVGSTIAHSIKGNFGTSSVVLLPAGPGTGVIAGTAVRAVCECSGIKDILTKSFGSTNPINLVKATIDALKQLRGQSDVERSRGVSLS